MTMMNAKIGTKTWTDKPADSIRKSEGVATVSAQDQERLGISQSQGGDVGSVLNRIADPNYTDPAKRVRAVGNDKLDKDAFMKLMLAQMKNQDPTNPLKSHEMAAQLAQFSGVEQMMNINTTLNDMKNAQKPTESFQALNLIGKAVAGDSAKVIRVKGDKTHDFTYNLPDDAQDIKIKVRNETGDVVRTVDIKNQKKGEQTWTWNGQSEQGTTTPAGEYQFLIEAKTSSGKKLYVKTDFEGMISGISYSHEGPVLLVGNQSVKFKDVKKIVDPRLENTDQKNDQKSAAPQNTDLRKAAPAAQNDIKGAPDKASEQASNLESVGMSRGLEEKLGKEVSNKMQEAPVKETKPTMGSVAKN